MGNGGGASDIVVRGFAALPHPSLILYLLKKFIFLYFNELKGGKGVKGRGCRTANSILREAGSWGKWEGVSDREFHSRRNGFAALPHPSLILYLLKKLIFLYFLYLLKKLIFLYFNELKGGKGVKGGVAPNSPVITKPRKQTAAKGCDKAVEPVSGMVEMAPRGGDADIETAPRGGDADIEMAPRGGDVAIETAPRREAVLLPLPRPGWEQLESTGPIDRGRKYLY